MRLIKQDGRVDIPYERVIVSLKPHVVLYCTIYEVIAYATSLDNDDTYWVLGKYLTESKAKNGNGSNASCMFIRRNYFSIPIR